MQGPVVIKRLDQLTTSWLSLLMRMLSHPVVKRSQQLTDRMLRLLAQISRSIDAPPLATSYDSTSGGDGRQQSSQAASSSAQNVDQQQREADNVGQSSSTAEEEATSDRSNTATMGASAGTSNTSSVSRSSAAPTTATTTTDSQRGSITVTTETSPPPPSSSTSDTQQRDAAASSSASTGAASDMRDELKVAVGVLTSHACSEEGLEDATSLLLQLSKSAVPLRSLIITLLLEGAQTLGEMLGEQIRVLHQEIITYNGGQASDAASPSSSSSGYQTKGQMVNRFDQSLTVVLSAKDKFRKIGRELQLPSMQPLTTKTSRQAFFLRILKVILQLQQAANGGSGHPIITTSSNSAQPNLRNQIRRWRRGNCLV